MDHWRPDVDVPREYPPPTAYLTTPAGHQAARSRHPGGPPGDPRDTPDRSALQRCLADVEAAALRLRALLKALGD